MSKSNSTMYKKNFILRSKGNNLRYVRMAQFSKVNITHHTNKLKKKNHMFISTDTEKAFDNIHPFMIKFFSKLRIEGHFLNYLQNPKADIILTHTK